MEKAKDGLIGVKDQPACTEKYASLDKGPATYGVVKKARDNDMELHTDQQVSYQSFCAKGWAIFQLFYVSFKVFSILVYVKRHT